MLRVHLQDAQQQKTLSVCTDSERAAPALHQRCNTDPPSAPALNQLHWCCAGRTAAAPAAPLLHRLYDLGVVAFFCGHGPHHLRFLPPVGVMQPEDITEVMGLLEQAMDQEA